MAKRKPRASNYIEPGQKSYIKRLEEAGDTRPKKVKDQEQEIDQVFDPDSEQQESNDDRGFLEKFWDTLTE